MQSDEVDISAALTSLLKTMKEMDKLSSKPLAKIKKVTCEMVYQCQAIRNFLDAQSYFQDRSQDYCSRVIECIRSRMAWFDLQLMRDVTSMLGPHGWEKAVEDDSTGAISI